MIFVVNKRISQTILPTKQTLVSSKNERGNEDFVRSRKYFKQFNALLVLFIGQADIMDSSTTVNQDKL